MQEPAAADLKWIPQVFRTSSAIRRRVLEHTIRNNGGYLSQACSSAETLATLYLRVMKLGPSTAPPVPPPFPGVPKVGLGRYTGASYNGEHSPHLDRLYVSAVHYALPVYAALIEVGRMSAEGLSQFNQDGSTVEMIGAEHSPGHEVTGGSLGQTLSQAGGIALARRLRGETGRNWVFMSDGEFQSGQTWEAIQALSFHGLDRVGIYVDVNGQQCDGKMSDVMNVEPLQARLEAFGARVLALDGHDPVQLSAPAELEPDGRPLVVLAYTNPCQGVPLLERRRPKLHYVRFKDESERAEYENFLQELSRDDREEA